MDRRVAVLGVLLGACTGEPPPATAVLEGRESFGTVRALVADPEVPVGAAAFEARAREVRGLLYAGSALPPLRRVRGDQLVATQTEDGVRVEHLLLDGFEGMHLPATLYLPETASQDARVPGMVVNVGHDANGQNAWYVRRLAWSLARGGVAALTIDWLGTGTRFAPEARHIPVGLRSILAGLVPEQPLLGEPLSAWDYLAARAEVDPSRVGMVGQSGGGMTTMHLAALEPRIALAVVVDIVATNTFMTTTLVGWGDPDSAPTGELGATSHGEILGVIAPRPLLVMSGDDDLGIAPSKVTEAALATTKRWYAARGGRIVFEGFPTAHEFSRGKIDRALAFVGEEFLGAPITGAQDPPASTAPRARPPEADPVWLELVDARWATTPAEVPLAIEQNFDWVRAAQAEIQGTLGTAAPTAYATHAEPDTILWVSAEPVPVGLDALGPSVVAFRPLGLDAQRRDEDDRRFLAQNARGVGSSVLRLGLDDLQGAVRALRHGGARRVVATCDGEQAALLCAALASSQDPPDGVALAGLPESFPTRFPLDAADPSLAYVAPGLGAVATPETLLAAGGPIALAVVDAPASWTFLPRTYERIGGSLALDAVDLVDATARVVGATMPP